MYYQNKHTGDQISIETYSELDSRDKLNYRFCDDLDDDIINNHRFGYMTVSEARRLAKKMYGAKVTDITSQIYCTDNNSIDEEQGDD